MNNRDLTIAQKILGIPIGVCISLVGLGAIGFIFTGSDIFPPFRPPQTNPKPTDAAEIAINNLWVILGFVLVMLMQPGFAFLEAGLIRASNAINVLFKNTIDVCLGGLFFYLIGYSLMFNGEDATSSLKGALALGWQQSESGSTGIHPHVHFLFQFAFAMTAATICSGAVAGRIRIGAYFVITMVLSIIVYPIAGYWVWSGSGWLTAKGFHDFAGSSVVHCVGAFAGLAGAVVLGPRIARFNRADERILRAKETPDLSRQSALLHGYNQSVNNPHSLPLVTLGTFLLWIAWFGFNGASELAIVGSDHTERVSRILTNTLLSACAGGVFSTILSAALNKILEGVMHIDMESTLNGILGGLVAITAGCDLINNPVHAIFIGAIAGALVVLTISYMQGGLPWFQVDDPVGAFAVHGVCGVFGTIVCGFFPGADFLTQTIGTAIISAWSFCVSFLVFAILWIFGRHRVSEYQEIVGLDKSYHGKSAYRID